MLTPQLQTPDRDALRVVLCSFYRQTFNTTAFWLVHAATLPWTHSCKDSCLSHRPTKSRARLTVALEAEAVVPLPCCTPAGAQLVGGMALVSQTSVLLASAGQPT